MIAKSQILKLENDFVKGNITTLEMMSQRIKELGRPTKNSIITEVQNKMNSLVGKLKHQDVENGMKMALDAV